MSPHFFHVEGVAAAVAILAFAWGILKWGYRTARHIDDTFTYVAALKTNHIPHLQAAVEAIARHLGIDVGGGVGPDQLK